MTLHMLEVPEETEEDKSEEAPVALNNVMTQDSAEIMKVEGQLQGTPVTILIDCGATHNFISPELVREKEIPIDEDTEFKVTLGTGRVQKSHDLCSRVNVHINDLKVGAELRRLPLGSADMILGMQWLKTLGDTKFNWRDRTMEFKYGGIWVKLKGDPTLRPTKALRDQDRSWQRKVQQDGYNEESDGRRKSRPKDYGHKWPYDPPNDLEDRIGLWGAGPDTSDRTSLCASKIVECVNFRVLNYYN